MWVSKGYTRGLDYSFEVAGGVLQCARTVDIPDDLCSHLTSLGGFKGLGLG